MELPPRERIILAIDTSGEKDAEYLAAIAQESGARFVKLGLELSSATSWQYCSDLAAAHELKWVADAKLDDIPNTVRQAVKNIKSLNHPPFGITIHTTAGIEAMRSAQQEAETVKMLGVTVLTSINENEAKHVYRVPVEQKVMELARDAAYAGLQGVVSSPREIHAIKKDPATKDLFTMIPGTRSSTVPHADQARVSTPATAIRDGADLLVIGRQITGAGDPAEAYGELIAEIEGAM